MHDTFDPLARLCRDALVHGSEQGLETPCTHHVMFINDRDDQTALREDEFGVVVKVELSLRVSWLLSERSEVREGGLTCKTSLLSRKRMTCFMRRYRCTKTIPFVRVLSS